MTTSHYQAARENLFGHVPFLQRRMPGMLIRDLGGALLVDSGLGSDTFNREWPFPRRRSARLRCGPAPRTKAR